MEYLFVRYLEICFLFFVLVWLINEEWKIRLYFGVFFFFFKVLEKERDNIILKIFSSGLISFFIVIVMVLNF